MIGQADSSFEANSPQSGPPRRSTSGSPFSSVERSRTAITPWADADFKRWELFITPSPSDDDDTEDWHTADEGGNPHQFIGEVATARSADHSAQATPSTASTAYIDDEIRSAASELTSISIPYSYFENDPAEDLESLLKQVDKQILAYLEGIDAVEEHLSGNTRLDMHRLASQCFKSKHDSRLADYVKMSAGSADILTGTHKCIEQLHSLHITTGWPRTLASFSCGTIIGSTILIVAGINGMKHGVKDAKNIKQLVEPLKTYKSFLLDLQKELRSSGTCDVADLISRTSKGVEARLQIAKRQMAHALFEIAESAAHAGLGAIGVAEGAAALAHSLSLVKVLGAVYASAIAGFGAFTAAKSGVHLHELKKLSKEVKRKLPEDDPLRKPLLEFIAHERKTRTHEVTTRALMGAAGATSAGLQFAGIAGAVPTAGASCGLLAMGGVMGCATAAAFKPIKSRQHALRTVAGVEHLTHESAAFLHNPEHLSHLLEKTRQEEQLEASVRNEVILGAPAIEDTSTFKRSHRLHRVLSKVIPSAEWRFVAKKMASQTESFSEPSLRFMLESTELERQYQSYKLPLLQQDLKVLMANLEAASSAQTSNDGDSEKQGLSEQLMIVAQACRLAAMRLGQLEDLELQLTNFLNQHPDSKKLGNSEATEAWNNIQIDFILAHGMETDALSKKERKEVLKKLDMQVPHEAGLCADPLREALREDINTRFAKVFAHSFPKRIGYMQRGVIEIALEMFCDEDKKKKKDQAINERNDLSIAALNPSTDTQGQQGWRGGAGMGGLHMT